MPKAWKIDQNYRRKFKEKKVQESPKNIKNVTSSD